MGEPRSFLRPASSLTLGSVTPTYYVICEQHYLTMLYLAC